MQWSLIIGTILAAALGVMVDWLLKPLLPERPTLKHLLAGAVFVLVLAFVLVRLSPPSDSTPVASSTDEIRKCMAQHGLAQAQAVIGKGTADAVLRFARCDWPPPTYADPDGYSEIRVRYDSGPGVSEASGANYADRIAASCKVLTLAYSFGSQGTFQHLPPFVVQQDSIVTVDGKPWIRGANPLPFYPERGEIVVLHNAKNGLDSATCAQ